MCYGRLELKSFPVYPLRHKKLLWIIIIKKKLEIKSASSWNEIATIDSIIYLGVFNLQHTCYLAAAHPRFPRSVNYYYTQRCTRNNTQTSRLVVRLHAVNLWLSNLFLRLSNITVVTINTALNNSCYFAKNVCVVYDVSTI